MTDNNGLSFNNEYINNFFGRITQERSDLCDQFKEGMSKTPGFVAPELMKTWEWAGTSNNPAVVKAAAIDMEYNLLGIYDPEGKFIRPTLVDDFGTESKNDNLSAIEHYSILNDFVHGGTRMYRDSANALDIEKSLEGNYENAPQLIRERGNPKLYNRLTEVSEDDLLKQAIGWSPEENAETKLATFTPEQLRGYIAMQQYKTLAAQKTPMARAALFKSLPTEAQAMLLNSFANDYKFQEKDREVFRNLSAEDQLRVVMLNESLKPTTEYSISDFGKSFWDGIVISTPYEFFKTRGRTNEDASADYLFRQTQGNQWADPTRANICDGVANIFGYAGGTIAQEVALDVAMGMAIGTATVPGAGTAAGAAAGAAVGVVKSVPKALKFLQYARIARNSNKARWAVHGIQTVRGAMTIYPEMEEYTAFHGGDIYSWKTILPNATFALLYGISDRIEFNYGERMIANWGLGLRKFGYNGIAHGVTSDLRNKIAMGVLRTSVYTGFETAQEMFQRGAQEMGQNLAIGKRGMDLLSTVGNAMLEEGKEVVAPMAVFSAIGNFGGSLLRKHATLSLADKMQIFDSLKEIQQAIESGNKTKVAKLYDQVKYIARGLLDVEDKKGAYASFGLDEESGNVVSNALELTRLIINTAENLSQEEKDNILGFERAAPEAILKNIFGEQVVNVTSQEGGVYSVDMDTKTADGNVSRHRILIDTNGKVHQVTAEDLKDMNVLQSIFANNLDVEEDVRNILQAEGKLLEGKSVAESLLAADDETRNKIFSRTMAFMAEHGSFAASAVAPDGSRLTVKDANGVMRVLDGTISIAGLSDSTVFHEQFHGVASWLYRSGLLSDEVVNSLVQAFGANPDVRQGALPWNDEAQAVEAEKLGKARAVRDRMFGEYKQTKTEKLLNKIYDTLANVVNAIMGVKNNNETREQVARTDLFGAIATGDYSKLDIASDSYIAQQKTNAQAKANAKAEAEAEVARVQAEEEAKAQSEAETVAEIETVADTEGDNKKLALLKESEPRDKPRNDSVSPRPFSVDNTESTSTDSDIILSQNSSEVDSEIRYSIKKQTPNDTSLFATGPDAREINGSRTYLSFRPDKEYHPIGDTPAFMHADSDGNAFVPKVIDVDIPIVTDSGHTIVGSPNSGLKLTHEQAQNLAELYDMESPSEGLAPVRIVEDSDAQRLRDLNQSATAEQCSFTSFGNSAPIRHAITSTQSIAKKHFGITSDWKKTGYILNDGSQLDFSGKHWGADQGRRSVDHRDINEINIDMFSFIGEGAIRVVSEVPAITLSAEPTSEQYSMIEDFFNKTKSSYGEIEILDQSGNTKTFVKLNEDGNSPFSGREAVKELQKYFTAQKGDNYVSPFAQFRDNFAVRHLILGKKGATNLDNAETAIKNLDLAKKFLKRFGGKWRNLVGEEQRFIRLATGWEVGADGKWRYEKFSDIYNEAEIAKKASALEGGEPVSIAEFFRSEHGNEIFRCYPDLLNWTVQIMPKQWMIDHNVRGQCRPARKAITIGNDGNGTAIMKAIIHEVQHAIQTIEGFEPGANPKQFTNVQLSRKDSSLAPMDLYMRTAGEVEARNAERRDTETINLKRKEYHEDILLEETEDVARKDQKFWKVKRRAYAAMSKFEEEQRRYKISHPQLDDLFVKEDGSIEMPIANLRSQKNEPQSSIDNAWSFMGLASRGETSKRAPIHVVDNGDGTYTVVDGNATTHALARHGYDAARVQVLGKNLGTRRENSKYELPALVQKPIRDAAHFNEADGKLRCLPIIGLTGDAAVARIHELARENAPALRAIGEAVKNKLGCEMLARPNPKKAERIHEKTQNDNAGDYSRIIDADGITLVLKQDMPFDDAIKAIKKNLQGAKIAQVKLLNMGADAVGYGDVKVNIEFANGGISEIIIVADYMAEVKDYCGGHVVYDMTRAIGLYLTNRIVRETFGTLKDLESAVYSRVPLARSDLDSIKETASAAVQRLIGEEKNTSLSSLVIASVKSSYSKFHLVRPHSVVSTAMPSLSFTQNIEKPSISADGESLANQGEKVKQNQSIRRKISTWGRGLTPDHKLCTVLAMDAMMNKGKLTADIDDFKKYFPGTTLSNEDIAKTVGELLDSKNAKFISQVRSLMTRGWGSKAANLTAAKIFDSKLPSMFAAALTRPEQFASRYGKRGEETFLKAREKFMRSLRGLDLDEMNAQFGTDLIEAFFYTNPDDFAGIERKPRKVTKTGKHEAEDSLDPVDAEARDKLIASDELDPEAVENDKLPDDKRAVLDQIAEEWAKVSEQRRLAREARRKDKSSQEAQKEDSQEAQKENAQEAQKEAAEEVNEEDKEVAPTEEEALNAELAQLFHDYDANITDADQFAYFLRAMTRIMLSKKYGIAEDEVLDPKKHPEMVEIYAKTLRARLGRYAVDTIVDATPKQLINLSGAINKRLNSHSPAVLEKSCATILKMIQRLADKSSKQATIKDIRKWVKHLRAQTRGKPSIADKLKTLVSREAVDRARLFLKAIKLTTTAVANRIDAQNAQIEEITKRYMDAGFTNADDDATIAKLTLERDMLQTYGGLRSKSTAEFTRTYREFRSFVETELAEYIKSRDERRENNKNIRQILVGAMNSGEAAPPDSGIGTFGRASFQQALERLISRVPRNSPLYQSAMVAIRDLALRIYEAEVKFTNLFSDFGNERTKILVEAYGSVKEAEKHLKEYIPEEAAKVLANPELGAQVMTYGQAIQLYSSLKQESLFTTLELKQRRMEALNVLEGVLTAKDHLFWEKLLQVYESRRDMISNAMIEYAARPVLMQDPYYAPVHRFIPNRSGLDPSVASFTGISRAFSERVKNNHWFDTRVDVVSALDSSNFSTAQLVAFGAEGSELVDILANKEAKDAMLRAVGQKEAEGILNHLRDIIMQRVPGASRIDEESAKWFRLFQTSASHILLGLNINVFLKQLSAFGAFDLNNAEGASYVWQAFKGWLSGSGEMRVAYKTLMQSPEWRSRYGDNERTIDAFFNLFRDTHDGRTFKQKLAEANMALVKGGDKGAVMMVAPIIFIKKERELLSRGLPAPMARAQAITYTMYQVESSQQSGLMSFKPEIMRNGGIWASLVGQFQSASNLLFSYESEAYRNMMRAANPDGTLSTWETIRKILDAKKQGIDYGVGKFGRALFINHVLIPFITWGCGSTLRRWEGKEDEPDKLDLLVQMLLGPAGGLILFGAIYESTLTNMIKGDDRWSGVGGMPAQTAPIRAIVDVAGATLNSAGAFLDAAYGNKFYGDAWEETLQELDKTLKTLSPGWRHGSALVKHQFLDD